MNAFPQFDLSGQVALITGAGRGLGRAIALALAHAGADVALGLRDINTGADLVEGIEAMGRRALPLQMDVTRLDQVSRGITDTAARRATVRPDDIVLYRLLPYARRDVVAVHDSVFGNDCRCRSAG